jgi:hypothetical protein
MLDTQGDDRRFGFGVNWLDFARHLTAGQIAEAQTSVRNLLRRDSLAGAGFVDIGCGSGVFSLAARWLGARVHSFDYDPDSVRCTQGLRDQYCPGDQDWTIEQGSVLDHDYLRTLGRFDVAYSRSRLAGGDFRSYVENYRSRRGMDFEHDVHDWMGGYPYESGAATRIIPLALPRTCRYFPGDEFVRLMQRNFFYFHVSSVWFNAAVLRSLGGFPLELRWHGDLLAAYVAAFECGAVYTPDAVSYVRISPSSYGAAGARSDTQLNVPRAWLATTRATRLGATARGLGSGGSLAGIQPACAARLALRSELSHVAARPQDRAVRDLDDGCPLSRHRAVSAAS